MTSSPHNAQSHRGSLSVDEVKLRRDRQPPSIYAGAFRQAWDLVKAKPVETLVLSFLYLVFTGGAGGWNAPDFRSKEGTPPDAETPVEAMRQIQEFIASLDLFDWAFLAGFVTIGLIVGVLVFVIGTLVRGGANIFWLRLVRGQDAQFGHTVAVARFFVPLLVATVAASIGIGVGVLFLIIPGIVLALGWFFVTQVVVDKDIGYFDALKASWRMTRGYKGQLFVFAILCGLLNLVGVLACCVGVVVTNAIVMGAVVIVYDRIAEPGNAYLEEGAEPNLAVGT